MFSKFLAASSVALVLYPFSKTFFDSLHTKTFIWGNGHYQARPDANIQFSNFTPKEISTFSGEKSPNLQEIFFGPVHSLGIDSNKNLYIWEKHTVDAAESTPHEFKRDIKLLDKNFKQIAFTKGFIWGLNDKNEVFQWAAKEKNLGEKRHVKTLEKIVQISGGEDHFAALNSSGEVFVMGDDTFGQCGQGSENRSSAPPFYEKRIRNPVKVKLPKIKKIVCGSNHTLAISEEGKVYGWGSNSNLQLSHEMEFSLASNPLIAVYNPLSIDKRLESSEVLDVQAGNQFSVFVTKNKITGEAEVYSCGENLHGELGIGMLKHVSDVEKIESLSNYKIKTEKGEKNIEVNQISCGLNHCMSLLSVGAVLEWGANEFGQLGNKKRSFVENPLIVNKFLNEKVVKVSCGYNNSAVIVENLKK